MSVMTETITRHVSEQVKRAMEAGNLARPLPHFDYVPITGCEPSHRQVHVPSPHSTEMEREASWSNRGGRPYSGHHDRHTAMAVRPSSHPIQGQTAKSTTAYTPYATHSRWTAWLEEQMGHPMLQRPPPITVTPMPQNARKYCEFYEQNGHTTTECRELKKGLHELADKGRIDRFLKRGPHFLRREQEPAQPQQQDEECLAEVVAIIAGGYAEGMTRSAWKAQLRGT
ncbi:hypothetical protein Cgig2_028167 [Carnegiea gigantea]|uniref:Retrotransposon gag domain-containing protein n=1 Tax=Carnegiea gigantea TaxID=171969 RepID=A0A9Q1GV52_9CARY|nr:hypothetical protein Cgig2_028167 [Carnegiea gigantea]